MALRMDKRLIPVLVRGGRLPPRHVLPADLSDLVGRQAIELRRDYWYHNIQLLLAQVPQVPQVLQVLPDETPRDYREDELGPYPRCFPEGTDPIPEDRLERILANSLKEWEKVVSALPENPSELRVELYRAFVFKSFADAIGFMSQVAPSCDIAMHHPRWENIWKTIRVYLTTWDIGHQISDRDVQLARYFDRAFAEFAGAEVHER